MGDLRLCREITDEERRIWPSTWYACIIAVPVHPAGTAEVYSVNGRSNIEYDDVPDGKYLLVKVDDDG